MNQDQTARISPSADQRPSRSAGRNKPRPAGDRNGKSAADYYTEFTLLLAGGDLVGLSWCGYQLLTFFRT